GLGQAGRACHLIGRAGGMAMMRKQLALFTLAAVLAVCGLSAAGADDETAPAGQLETAVFAGGCFWCVEEAFDQVEGVVETTSGYIGGTQPNPTYMEVSAGGTGHAEAVRVRYDPNKVSYRELLNVFWRNIDPTDAGGQFCDRGDSYRSAIFVADAEQRRLAEASKKGVAMELGQPIATEIAPAGEFYPAED